MKVVVLRHERIAAAVAHVIVQRAHAAEEAQELLEPPCVGAFNSGAREGYLAGPERATNSLARLGTLIWLFGALGRSYNESALR